MHPETRVRKFSQRHYPNTSITVSTGLLSASHTLHFEKKDLRIQFDNEDLGPISTKDKLSV
jgi:hypothetical protein